MVGAPIGTGEPEARGVCFGNRGIDQRTQHLDPLARFDRHVEKITVPGDRRSEQGDRDAAIATFSASPVQRAPQVVQVRRDLADDFDRWGALQHFIVVAFELIQHHLRVAVHHLRRRTARSEAFKGERTCRFQQPVPRVCTIFHGDQRFIHQRAEMIEHRPLVDPVIDRECLRALERKAAGKNADPLEHRLLRRRQQPVAPLEGSAQSLMSAQGEARARGQQPEPLVQPRANALDAEQRHARCCQLDRQRNSVQSTADLDDRAEVFFAQPQARLDRLRARNE